MKHSVIGLVAGLLILGHSPLWADSPLTATKDAQGQWGATDGAGRVVVPFRYAGLRFDETHRRFAAWLDVGGRRLQGMLDEQGKIVVPFEYDALERISNSGDEPTHLAKRGKKYGYIDIVSGETLIPPKYDALRVNSLLTDMRGRGIAVAAKAGKFGVISTEDAVLVPFEFDRIGDLDGDEGALAERTGKLVWISFQAGRYIGVRDVPTIYASNFIGRRVSINPEPFDGLYAASDYPDMMSAWRGWRNSRLRWAAIPSLQIDRDAAFVAFGVFAEGRLPLLPNEFKVRRRAQGFDIYVDEPDTGFTLSFETAADGVSCNQCERWGLPSLWRRVSTATPAPFGGIGIAMQKSTDPGSPLRVLDVLDDGPARRAGVQAGDHILSIDGRNAIGLTAESARDALRGAAGSQVHLRIIRTGLAVPLELSITRSVIQMRTR